MEESQWASFSNRWPAGLPAGHASRLGLCRATTVTQVQSKNMETSSSSKKRSKRPWKRHHPQKKVRCKVVEPRR